MVRRNPFTRRAISERATWPESNAALRGPESYDELGILSRAQRRQLVQLARVEPEREKAFLDELACCINGYRHRKRHHAQESPAAVAEAMRQLIEIVDAYKRKVLENPLYVMLKPPLPTDDWFEHAEEKLRRKERLVKGHRPRSITQDLLHHALALQGIAGAYSDYLAADRGAMQRWLAEALVVSGERPVGKNTRAAYFEQLMLPRAVDGSGRPPALDTFKTNQ
jgi:hypothetical protein